MSAFHLAQVIDDKKITRENDSDFVYECQKDLLLVLLEKGVLTQAGFDYANNALVAQYHSRKNSDSNSRNDINSISSCSTSA